MSTLRHQGRSGRSWEPIDVLLRPGHLRPLGTQERFSGATVLVRDADGDVYGALRSFPTRGERTHATAVLAAGNPVTPALLDIVDDPSLPPSLVTSWAPGSSTLPIGKLRERDDLAAMLEVGHRWTPTDALRALVPLGQALDAMAEQGFTPIELSPDHLVFNSGSICLVGIGRHVYLPAEHRMPGVQGMSLPSALLLGDDLPISSGATAQSTVQWRDVQQRALLRLAAWMACGLAPAAWGRVRDQRDLAEYLTGFAGFTQVPSIRPGRLAESLEKAAALEEAAATRKRITQTKAILVYDDTCSAAAPQNWYAWAKALEGRQVEGYVTYVDESRLTATVEAGSGQKWDIRLSRVETPEAEDFRSASRHISGLDLRSHYRIGQRVTVFVRHVREHDQGPFRWPVAAATIVRGPGERAPAAHRRGQLRMNPESIRLGLLLDHGDAVMAFAAFDPSRWTSTLASQLSGAGWVLVSTDELADLTRRATVLAAAPRLVVAGRRSTALDEILSGTRHPWDQVDPEQHGPMPVIAGRQSDTLPYVSDDSLVAYGREMCGDMGGASLRRRTFAAGWAIALGGAPDPSDTVQARARIQTLIDLAGCFGVNTELLLAVRTRQNAPGMHRRNARTDRRSLKKLVDALSGVPRSDFRRDLISTLLGATSADLYTDAARYLLPVSTTLANVYRARSEIGADVMEIALRDKYGMRRVGLYGRLSTAVPDQDPEHLAAAVAAMDDALIKALCDIPAPSLQYLAARLESPDLLQALRPFMDGGDLDLLNRYTPRAWSLLLEGLRQPEHLGHLGLGWALVVADDPEGTVDARVILRIAADAARSPAEAVRALLATPREHWAAVMVHPALAAAWLSTYGTLEIGAVVAAFPEAEETLGRIGVATLRHAVELGLDQPGLATLAYFAEAVPVDTDDVLSAFLERGYGPECVAGFASAAAAAWTARHLPVRLGRGRTAAQALRWCVGNVVENPHKIWTWAVDGPGRLARVLADVLGASAQALAVPERETAELTALLERGPYLLGLLERLYLPTQRLALLRLAAGESGHLLSHPEVPECVAELLAEPEPQVALRLLAEEALPLSAQVIARRLRLGPEGRKVLAGLGPLATVLPGETLVSLVEIGNRHGLAAALSAGIVEQWRTGTVQVVEAWGPAWLPWLTGRDGARVHRLLAQHRHGHARSSAVLSPWLMAAGEDGLELLDRYGAAALDLVLRVRPHPEEALLLGELLRWGGPVEQVYDLVLRNGIPAHSWSSVARDLAEGLDETSVLLRLWSSSRG